MARKKASIGVDGREDIVLASTAPQQSWKMWPLEKKVLAAVSRSAPEIERKRFRFLIRSVIRPAMGTYFAMVYYGGVPRSELRNKLVAVQKAAAALIAALRDLDGRGKLFDSGNAVDVVEKVERQSVAGVDVLCGTKQDSSRPLRVCVHALADGWIKSGGSLPTFTLVEDDPDAPDGNPFCEVVRIIFDHLREVPPAPGDDIVPTHFDRDRVRSAGRPILPDQTAVDYALKTVLTAQK